MKIPRGNEEETDPNNKTGNTGERKDNMNITISKKVLNQARDVILTAREQCAAIDAQRDALPKIDPQRDGSFAVERRNRDLAEMEQAKAAIMDQGAATLKALRAQYDAALADQVTPKGADLDNSDYILIRDQLIDTPQQLQALAARHNNIAFLRAVQNYAQGKNWPGFDQGVTTAQAIGKAAQEYGKTYFDMCDVAVYHLDGLAAMQVCDEDEITRKASAYGVLGSLGD